MPVTGNVNGLAILPGSKLLDVDVLMREHSELREALRGLDDAINKVMDVDSSTRIGNALAISDNLLCAIREREDSELHVSDESLLPKPQGRV